MAVGPCDPFWVNHYQTTEVLGQCGSPSYVYVTSSGANYGDAVLKLDASDLSVVESQTSIADPHGVVAYSGHVYVLTRLFGAKTISKLSSTDLSELDIFDLSSGAASDFARGHDVASDGMLYVADGSNLIKVDPSNMQGGDSCNISSEGIYSVEAGGDGKVYAVPKSGFAAADTVMQVDPGSMSVVNTYSGGGVEEDVTTLWADNYVYYMREGVLKKLDPGSMSISDQKDLPYFSGDAGMASINGFIFLADYYLVKLDPSTMTVVEQVAMDADKLIVSGEDGFLYMSGFPTAVKIDPSDLSTVETLESDAAEGIAAAGF